MKFICLLLYQYIPTTKAKPIQSPFHTKPKVRCEMDWLVVAAGCWGQPPLNQRSWLVSLNSLHCLKKKTNHLTSKDICSPIQWIHMKLNSLNPLMFLFLFQQYVHALLAAGWLILSCSAKERDELNVRWKHSAPSETFNQFFHFIHFRNANCGWMMKWIEIDFIPMNGLLSYLIDEVRQCCCLFNQSNEKQCCSAS